MKRSVPVMVIQVNYQLELLQFKKKLNFFETGTILENDKGGRSALIAAAEVANMAPSTNKMPPCTFLNLVASANPQSSWGFYRSSIGNL